MSTGDPQPYNYCGACCGPCRVYPDPFFAQVSADVPKFSDITSDYKLKLADCEVKEPYVPGSLTMSPEQMAAMADRVSEQFIKDSPKAAAYLGFTKPKMEPRKSDRDLILKEEFDDKVDRLFYILKDRQRCLYEAKETLTGNTVELHQADTSRDYGKLGCKIMLTREELLAGVNRRVNFAEDEAQIVVRELHATLGSLIADLKYRPPIEAEQWNP